MTEIPATQHAIQITGVDEFIHVRSDVHAVLTGVAGRIGVEL